MKKITKVLAVIAAIAMLAVCAAASTGFTLNVDGDTVQVINSSAGDVAGKFSVSVSGGTLVSIGEATGMLVADGDTASVIAIDAAAGAVLAVIAVDAAGDFAVTVTGLEDDFSGSATANYTVPVADPPIVAPPVVADPPAETSGNDTFTPTGVTVALVPALIAAAAVVATKKRK
jgi:hypothetical protein